MVTNLPQGGAVEAPSLAVDPYLFSAMSPAQQALAMHPMSVAVGAAEVGNRNALVPSEIELRKAQTAHALAQANQIAGVQPVTIMTAQGPMKVDPAHAMNYMAQERQSNISAFNALTSSRHLALQQQIRDDELAGRQADAKRKQIEATALENFQPTGELDKDALQLIKIDPAAAPTYLKMKIDQDLARKPRHIAEAWQNAFQQALADLGKDLTWATAPAEDRMSEAWKRADAVVTKTYDEYGNPRKLIGGTIPGATRPAPASKFKSGDEASRAFGY